MEAGYSKGIGMRKSTLAVLGIALLAVGYYFASPYWTIHQIRGAAQAGQGDRLATYVDFPAMRESIKSQLVLMMQKEMQRPEMKDNPFAGFGQMLAANMITGMVDSMVTPDAVANMLASGRAPNHAPGGKVAEHAPASAGEREVPRVRQGYEGLDTFKTILLDPTTDDEMLVAVLSRQGLFSWRLTAVRLPGLLKRP